MKYLGFFLLVWCASVWCQEAVETEKEEEEDAVIVGTADNWSELVTREANVLVEFYAPWCGHCKRLEPEYKKAANQLKAEGVDVKLVKVDATIEKDLASKYGVRGYPTLKFFKKGILREYEGGRSQREIVGWINKKLGPAALELTMASEVEDYRNSEAAVVIAFVDDRESALAKQYLLVAGELETESFGIANVVVGAELGITEPKIIVLKKFDNERADYTGEANYVTIRSFVQQQTTPLLITFNGENQKKIFGGDVKSHLFLFASKDEPELQNYKTILREIAPEFRGFYIFVYADTTDNSAKRILEYLDVQDGPTLRIMSQATGEGKKYKFEDKITTANLVGFIRGVIDGNIQPFYKSASEPEDWDKEATKILVGTSFDRVVNAPDINAFVEFYAPWCGHCKQLAPIWNELGVKVKANKNLVIAKVDSTENEIPGFGIRSYPTIKFFPANSDEVIDYTGGRTLDDFVKFLKEKLGDEFAEEIKEEEIKNEKTEPEEKTEEKKEKPLRVDL